MQQNKSGAFSPLDYGETEVYFPRAAKITFPLKNAKDNAIACGTDFWKEMRDAETPEGPSDELEEKSTRAAAGPSTDSPNGSDIAAGGSIEEADAGATEKDDPERNTRITID